MLRMPRMKIIYLPLLALLITFAASPSSAASRSEAKSDIEAAQKTMGSLEKSDLLKRYIPHKNYYDARVYLDTAMYQFSEERDYANASYFAIMALIETETAISIARSRLAVRKKHSIEEKIYREMAEGSGRRSQVKIALMEAGLSKDGQNQQRFFLDSQVFVDEKFELTDRGKKRLDAIATVMSIAPRSSLLVVGHTRLPDKDNLRSMQKAEAVASYIKSLKGVGARRVTVKGSGDASEITLMGRVQKADRVELILSGVQ